MSSRFLSVTLAALLSTAAAQRTAPPATSPPPLPADTPADRLEVLEQLVREDFALCGQDARMDERLNRVALQMLRGFDLKDTLKQEGLRAARAGSLTVAPLGKSQSVARALSGQCRNRAGYAHFGLAIQSGRAALVWFRPAELDLSQREEWLREFLKLVNVARYQGQRCGKQLHASVPPLMWDDRLQHAAATQAKELIQYVYRGHVNPVTGSTPESRTRTAGWPGQEIGENVAYDTLNPQDTLQAFLDSEGHCRELMNPAWTHMGAELANGTPITPFATYWVQVFGRAAQP